MIKWEWEGWWISDKRKDFTIRHHCWVFIGKNTSPEIPGAVIYVYIIGPLRIQYSKD
jgi:hypothetical protein